MKTPKFSLWYIEHESVYFVSATKHKDTNSVKEVDAWMKTPYHAASTYHRSDYCNADHIQFFDED